MSWTVTTHNSNAFAKSSQNHEDEVTGCCSSTMDALDALVFVSQHMMLDLGLCMVGFGRERQCRMKESSKESKFRALFGTGSETCAFIFRDLQTTGIIPNASIKQVNAANFLVSMYWLKNYPKEVELSGLFSKTEKTIRKWCWAYAESIQELKERKVNKHPLC